jgi:hypothetical protein
MLIPIAMNKKSKQTTHETHIQERFSLLLFFMVIIFSTMSYSWQFDEDPIKSSIEKAHELIWVKFIDLENGLLYDYVDSSVRNNIPVPEECKKGMPNALSWWVPNENGAFFNGIYLAALSKRWKVKKDNISESEARKVASGLKLLAQVGRKKGFVARGISTDGVSHFPVSSPDQVYPWFYGLYHYLQSGIPNATERASTISMMVQIADALEENSWKIPCERDDLEFFGDFSGSGFSDCARLVSILKFMHILTSDEKWKKLYHSVLLENPANSNKSRLDILAEGIPYQPPPAHNSFWTSSMDQAALKALFLVEKDNSIRTKFKNGLDSNAKSALEHIVLYKEFDNDHNLMFNPDWRLLNELWEPQKTMKEALELAERQLILWDEVSPAKGYELFNMMEPLNACWIVILSGNPEIIDPVKEEIISALVHYDWAVLNYSTFFIAECVYYEGLINGIFE